MNLKRAKTPFFPFTFLNHNIIMNKLTKTLIDNLLKQKELGELLLETTKGISSTKEVDEMIEGYNKWDARNKHLLEKGFTVDAQQFFRMYPTINYLGHMEVDKNSFEQKRKKLLSDLPKQIGHLNTTLQHLEKIDTVFLLPIDEHLQPITIKTINMKKIFLSHSSKDYDKVSLFHDLLETIGVRPNQIFFSSEPGYGITLGENLFNFLKKELNEESVVFFMFSEHFFSSPICMCEMGATWVLSKRHIPILIPPFNFSSIKGVFPNDIGCYINDKKQLNEIKAIVEKEFKIDPPLPTSRWEDKRDKYLEAINKLLPAV